MVSGAITPARRAANILFLLLPPLLPAALAFFQVVNGDIGFHVATGRYIDLAGKLPDSNVLSFAQPDHPWVLHQFLPAWLFHRVELAFGRDMLVAVKAVLVYLTFLFLWDAITRRIRSRGEGWESRISGSRGEGWESRISGSRGEGWESRISGSRGDVHRLSTDGAGTGHGSGAGTIDLLALGGWLFALAAGAAACRFFVRPFLFSDLGLAVLLAVLARYEQDRRPVRLVQAALVTGAFAPLHAGVIYMLLVLVAFAAGQAGAWAIGRWQARRGPIGHEVTGRSSGRTFGGTDTSGGTGNSSGEVDQEGPSPVRFPWGPVLLLPGALAAAAVALAVSDPSGIEALTLPFRFSVHPYFHEHLAEFRPFPFDLARYPFAWGLVAMTAGMGVGMVIVRWKGRRTV
ncbi:MAG: hypothetical protein FJ109_04785, partial [Deltaproteobacteria bacterium]|nr:hypothetical protein [Deltaproteobacteria bacterium]